MTAVRNVSMRLSVLKIGPATTKSISKCASENGTEGRKRTRAAPSNVSLGGSCVTNQFSTAGSPAGFSSFSRGGGSRRGGGGGEYRLRSRSRSSGLGRLYSFGLRSAGAGGGRLLFAFVLSLVLALVLVLVLVRGLTLLGGGTEGVKFKLVADPCFRVLAKPRSWSAMASIEWYVCRWAKRLIGASESRSRGRLDG